MQTLLNHSAFSLGFGKGRRQHLSYHKQHRLITFFEMRMTQLNANTLLHANNVRENLVKSRNKQQSDIEIRRCKMDSVQFQSVKKIIFFPQNLAKVVYKTISRHVH